MVSAYDAGPSSPAWPERLTKIFHCGLVRAKSELSIVGSGRCNKIATKLEISSLLVSVGYTKSRGVTAASYEGVGPPKDSGALRKSSPKNILSSSPKILLAMAQQTDRSVLPALARVFCRKRALNTNELQDNPWGNSCIY